MSQHKVFEELVYQIIALLKQGELYPRYIQSIEEGKNDYKISQVYTKKQYSTEWIDMIEDCIVALDTIVRNPRKFIVIEEDIVDISLARSISVESVKHLSQHTNLISSVTKDGMVIPSKILNTSKEESFEIYENRFIYTLLLKLNDFIEIRTNAIKTALMQSGELGVQIESEFAVDRNKVQYSMRSNANFPFDPYVTKSGGGVSDLERVSRIKMIISDFLSSPFGREMRTCALVRPPIQRTNVILKDPNFKKALVLWQYIETSEKMNYNIETSTETMEMNPAVADKFRSIVYLNTILMQSIAATHEASESVETKKAKEKVIADEYVTKNIDDFVPDDFPSLKLEIEQIRTIYKKIPTERTLSSAQIKKINGALDRVIRQYRINKLKEDSDARQKLIAEQLKEEKQAKLLALREKTDLDRRLRAERARKRLEDRREQAEKIAEIERLKQEEERHRKEREFFEQQKALWQQDLEKIKAENAEIIEKYLKDTAEKTSAANAVYDREKARLTAAQEEFDRAEKSFKEALNAYNTDVENCKKDREDAEGTHRKAIEEAARKEVEAHMAGEEAESLKRITIEKDQATDRINEERLEEIKKLRAENDRFWAAEQFNLVSLGIHENMDALKAKEKAAIEKINLKEQEEKEYLKEIEEDFRRALGSVSLENMNIMAKIAYNFGNADRIDRIIEKKISDLRKLQRKEKRKRRKYEK